MLIATEVPVTQIPARAMLDLEEIGGGDFGASYATKVDATTTTDGVLLLVNYEGELRSLQVDPATTVPVITYALSNTLENETQEVRS